MQAWIYITWVGSSLIAKNFHNVLQNFHRHAYWLNEMAYLSSVSIARFLIFRRVKPKL